MWVGTKCDKLSELERQALQSEEAKKLHEDNKVILSITYMYTFNYCQFNLDILATKQKPCN